jgi:uncharacterized membrane protein
MTLGFGHIALIYGLTVVVFFVVDLFWLGFAAKGLYDRHIGDLLREQVNWTAAVLFYLIYIGGIQLFVLIPAIQDGHGLVRTAVLGGLLGFFAYSTFDLTSLALLKGWSVPIVVVDLVWGTFLTGSTAVATLWLVRAVFKIG